MLLELEDVKRISLSPDDILWVKISEDCDMSQIQRIQTGVQGLMKAAGKTNKVVFTMGEVDFSVISDPSLKDRALVRGTNGQTVVIENLAPACDCGGAATGGGHVSYCSTQRRNP